MKIIKFILLLFLPIQIICQENSLHYNNIYRQAEIIIGDDGVRYSTVIRIGFNQKVVSSPLYNKELKVEDIINLEMREIFNAIKKKYGEYKIKKSFSGSIPNDTIKFSSLLKKNVKQNDYSQKITLKFLSPVPIDSIINILNRQKYVQYAVGPYEYRLTGEPDDTYFQISRWAFEKTQLIQSWDITKSNPNINIAIVDAFESFFITSLHSELQNKIDLPFYWTNTFGGHGLAIAGVAGAITNNSSGVSSSGWDSKILFERAWQWENLDWPGPPQGIRNAINRGAHIINCSFVTGPDPELMSAVQDAIRAGVVVVASAGNDYGFPIPSVLYPAAYNFGSEGQVIAISATICYDGLNETKVNSFNYSPGTDPVNDPTNSFIDFAAPGGNYSILSPSYYNDFVHHVSPGTSLATAFTSGIISLLKAINPNLTPTQVYNILKINTDKVGIDQYIQQSDGHTWNQYMGYGRINAYKALKYTLENYGGTLTQTLTIPSEETWNFQPGVTVKFANGVSLIVNGTLNAVGTSSNKITFTRSGTSGNWGGVVVNSGAYAYISYCDISYASTGISISNNSNRSMVTDCQINNSEYYGISIYNSQPALQRNKIINSPSGGAFGIFCNYYGYPFVKDNLIKGHGTSGVYCVDHSGVYWLNSTANNVIKTNQNGLYLNNYSNAYLGNNPYNGQNSIYSNTGYDVKAISNSIAYVQNTWWGVYPPNASKFYNDGNSTIDRTNPLTYDPNNSLNLYVSNETGNNNLYSPALNILSSENDDKKEIEEQLDLFKKNGSNKDGIEALQKIERLFTQYARKDFSEFSKKELRPLIKEKDRLYPLLLELEMHQLLINGNIKEALGINDQLEKEVNDKTANKLALFRKGFINLSENDRAAAEKAFVEFISKYPEDELTAIVNYTLGDKNNLNKAVVTNQEEKTAPEGFVLEDCYPNPFNPSTTIRYQIPQDGHISLKVYDMLGREVAQLVNEVKRAGEYTVSFDGSKLSSGVYIYKLVGNNVNLSKKMILMK